MKVKNLGFKESEESKRRRHFHHPVMLHARQLLPVKILPVIEFEVKLLLKLNVTVIKI